MKKEKKKRNYWPFIFGAALAVYFTFTLLDAFVIPHGMVTAQEEASPENEPAEGEESGEPVISENSYESEDISITLTRMNEYDTAIYAADVKIKDATCFRSGLAQGTFGRNVKETTSEMARENDAILAINGDYYGFRDSGYVLRNGELYRDKARDEAGSEDLVYEKDGTMKIVKEEDVSAQTLAEDGAWQIFSFGPALVSDGEIVVSEQTEVEQAMRSNPRTAIGQMGPKHYLFLVSDGRSEESAGLTLYELAEVMQELGCELAYNLDGGGSTTMVFNGTVVNQPTDGRSTGERGVSDIVYIGQ